ncbi:hypothetical protein [Streptomyces sp. NPDC058751]|uniref:hypothetical protein n=1 Tax=Streptomyces sp. NPDC058751 TaxID=3346623 RepID=UPI0036767FE7
MSPHDCDSEAQATNPEIFATAVADLPPDHTAAGEDAPTVPARRKARREYENRVSALTP